MTPQFSSRIATGSVAKKGTSVSELTRICFNARTISFRPSSSSTTSMPPVTLYQYAICPFCNKAEALLNYAGVSYDAIEVNPLTKAELKPWSGHYRKVPIALMGGEQVNGSNNIVIQALQHPAVVASLDAKWKGEMSMDDFQFSAGSKMWQSFAENDLASLLYPNICRTLGDSYQAFGYVNSVAAFGPLQKVAIRGLGSVAMFMAASKIKAKRGIDDEQKALDEALGEWETKGLGGGKLFSSGSSIPSLGDIAVFGVLRSVEGLPAHDRAVAQRGGLIPEWYNRMKEQVES